MEIDGKSYQKSYHSPKTRKSRDGKAVQADSVSAGRGGFGKEDSRRRLP